MRRMHSVHKMWPTATDGVVWSVCLCVCLSVKFMSPAKNSWTDRDANWRVDCGVLKEPYVRWESNPPWEGAILGVVWHKSIGSRCCGNLRSTKINNSYVWTTGGQLQCLRRFWSIILLCEKSVHPQSVEFLDHLFMNEIFLYVAHLPRDVLNRWSSLLQ